MWDALKKLIENIHGTDASLLGICAAIYFIASARKVSVTLALPAIEYMFYLGVAIVVLRVFLTLMNVRRRRRKNELF